MTVLLSCKSQEFVEIVTGIDLYPQRIMYIDSMKNTYLQYTYEQLDSTFAYPFDSIGWKYDKKTLLTQVSLEKTNLSPFSSAAYAFQGNEVFVYPNKLVARYIITIDDYNANFPAMSNISAICKVDSNRTFDNITKESNAEYFNEGSYFVLTEPPADTQEVRFRIIYEYENDETYYFTTSPIKLH